MQSDASASALQRCLVEGGCHLEKICIQTTSNCIDSETDNATTVLPSPRPGDCADRGVVCTQAVAAGDLLMSIPRSFLITVQVARELSAICKRLLAITEETGAEPDLSAPEQCHLAVFLLEQVHGASSAGSAAMSAPFLQHYSAALPRDFSSNPLYWGEDDLLHLQGSYLLQRIEHRRQNLQLDYEEICSIAPEMAELGTLQDFIWARCAVTSRNFGVDIDGVHTEVLVPNMLNHQRPRQTQWSFDQGSDAFVVHALVPLCAGQEVHDSYGRKCNARFLLNYGFTVENNYDSDSFKCYNECTLHIQLNSSDPAIRVKKNLFGRREGVTERERWGCVVRVSEDWNDLVSREALSLARFVCSRGKELLLLPILEDDVNLQKTIIAPLSATTEAAALRYIADLAREQLRRYPSSRSSSGGGDDDDDSSGLRVLPVPSNEANARVLIKGEKDVYAMWIGMEECCASILDAADAEGARLLLERLREEQGALQGREACRRRILGDYVEHIVVPTLAIRQRADS